MTNHKNNDCSNHRNEHAVTVGSGHRDYDRDRTTVIKEREPSERTTVMKKDHDDGTRSKTIIHDRDNYPAKNKTPAPKPEFFTTQVSLIAPLLPSREKIEYLFRKMRRSRAEHLLRPPIVLKSKNGGIT